MPPIRIGCEVRRMLRAVLFDMDGLMLDTERHSIQGWAQAAKRLGKTLPPALLEQTVGVGEERIGALMRQEFGADFDFPALVDSYTDIVWEDYRQNGIPVKQGLFTLLNYLEQKGYRRAVVTSSFEERAHRCLELAGLSKWFDAVICGDHVPAPKPEPYIYQKAMQALGCRPEECLALEDSPVGLTAAKRAGIATVLIPDLIQPDRIASLLADGRLEQLEQVVSYLEEWPVQRQNQTGDAVLQAILRRRSVRAFSKEPLESVAVELILRAGMAAPSANDSRPWRFVLLQERSLLDKLRAALPHSGALEGAAVAILLCGRPQSPAGNDDFWEQSCGAAAENMLLAASAQGIGGVWLGVWPRQERCAAVRALTELPERLIPFCVLAFGRPLEPIPGCDRYNAAFVRCNRWGRDEEEREV